jgi:photosystem II stability/assembly factor-like uncharacterized protein
VGGLPTQTPVAAFAADPTRSPVMYAASADGLWKSGDGGQTWQRLTTAPAGVTALAVHPLDQMRVFAGTGQGTLFRSADGGVSWQSVP